MERIRAAKRCFSHNTYICGNTSHIFIYFIHFNVGFFLYDINNPCVSQSSAWLFHKFYYLLFHLLRLLDDIAHTQSLFERMTTATTTKKKQKPSMKIIAHSHSSLAVWLGFYLASLLPLNSTVCSDRRAGKSGAIGWQTFCTHHPASNHRPKQ